MRDPDLSIVIAAHNGFHLISTCVTSILKHTHGITHEIIVVDDCSTDRSFERLCQAFPEIKVISTPSNSGYGVASNLGMENALGRYIAILNQDTEVRDESLARLVRLLDDLRDVGVVAPRLLNPDGTVQRSVYRFPSLVANITRQLVPLAFLEAGPVYAAIRWFAELLGEDLGGLEKKVHSGEVACPQGAAFVIRREIYEQVGGFDGDAFFLFMEEGDLFYRVDQAGWKVYYLVEASVIHYGSVTVNQFQHRYYIQQYKSFLTFYQKHYGWWKMNLYRILISPIFLLKAGAHALAAIMIRQQRLAHLKVAEMYFTIPRLFFDDSLRAQNVVKQMRFRYIGSPHK